MKTPLSFASAITLIVAVLLLAGCSGAAGPANPSGNTPGGAQTGGAADDGSGSPAANAPKGPKTYKLSDLSVGLGDYLPPLDEGRVEIAPPGDWRVGSRQKDYVVWFHQYKDARLLPQIRVTAEDAPEDAPQNATAADVDAYAKWVAGSVEKDLGAKETLIEPVVPLVLGENAFGRYVRAGKKGGGLIERQMLTTTHDGRVYTIELIVLPEELKKREVRDAGYVVGAGMKFQKAE